MIDPIMSGKERQAVTQDQLDMLLMTPCYTCGVECAHSPNVSVWFHYLDTERYVRPEAKDAQRLTYCAACADAANFIHVVRFERDPERKEESQ